jgi:NAD(P)-dependent dehydrogenase (short-subunit alcohol dehydrogenase family)
MILSDKVVIVTGGGRGIGRAAALLCAQEGAAVLVNDPGVARDGSGADSRAAKDVAQEIMVAGGQAYANFANIVDVAGAMQVVEDAISQFGRIDAVINAAGILRDAWWHRMTRDDWHEVIDVHLHGAFNICRMATPHFREQRSGSFVHFTSLAGLVGNRAQANYAAAKMAIVGLSQSLALDMARFGVRSNCIAPVAWTRMISEIVGQASEDDPAVAEIRDMTPEKVAPLAAYLASDDSVGISGQVFGIAGDEVTLYSRPQPVRSLSKAGGWSARSIADELAPAFAEDFVDSELVAEYLAKG